MARNEHSSNRLATIAARILDGKPYTDDDVKSLAGSVLTQALDTAHRELRRRRRIRKARKIAKPGK